MRKKLVGTLALATSVIAAVTTVVPAAADDVEVNVVGGAPATESYPWMASLQFKVHPVTGEPGGWHQCGASLIEPDKVVTAAHCVTAYAEDGSVELRDPSLFQVRVGSKDRHEGGQVRDVADIVVHPDWSFAPGGDMAVVHLATEVVDLPAIRISASPLHDHAEERRVIGWGRTEDGPPGDDSALPAELHELNVALIPDAHCATGPAPIEPGAELCAAPPGQPGGVCYGDSGGPLLVRREGKWFLEGIVSRGATEQQCAQDKGIFTDASDYLEWVLTH